jgi:hypothetical protein
MPNKTLEQKILSKNQSHMSDVKKNIITIACILALLLLIDLFFTGYIKYSIAYGRCGHAPISVVHNEFGWGGGVSYDVPGSRQYNIRAANDYTYCTRDQVEATGIEPNILSIEGQKRQKEIDAQNSK